MGNSKKVDCSFLLRLRNRYLLLIDLVALAFAAYFSFVVRLERWNLRSFQLTALIFTGVAVLTKILVFFLMGGYARYWLFASLPELFVIAEATLLAELLTTVLVFGGAPLVGFRPPPRSIPFLDLFFGSVAMALPRLGLRAYHYFYLRRTHKGSDRPLKRVMIVGAGEAGWLVLQEIRKNPRLGLSPVGFVDDDRSKRNLLIHGVRVLGPIEEIPRLVDEYGIQQVLIAIPSADASEMRRIVEFCRQAEVEALTLPGVYDLIAGNVQIQRFRPVRVEDLLAREPVNTDTTQVRLLLKGRRVLVTGAGGSIGSELCRQIAACVPSALLLLGHGENSIFHIHNELRRKFPQLDVRPLIADTRDRGRIEQIFAQHRPQIVFHAAAHKHVPLMEANPTEAVTNNVGGTLNLLRTSESYDVRTFVMISTDKAVNPTSVMGATKRVAEHLVQETALRTGDCYVAVRFGNVLGSRGSVVPLFESQIHSGGPVTVTHPEITRYFMTIPEAVQLVLQAAALGHGSEVFVLDMGEPIRIVDLARDMIRLAGFEVDEDIEIVFTGLRPGEKLYEELFLDDEHYQRTLHEKIFVSRNGLAPTSVTSRVEALLAIAEKGDVEKILAALRALVPECQDTFGEQARTMAVRE
ncbi:MAG: polysaccharide biosynthesis protein [Anaerolineae bacterium]